MTGIVPTGSEDATLARLCRVNLDLGALSVTRQLAIDMSGGTHSSEAALRSDRLCIMLKEARHVFELIIEIFRRLDHARSVPVGEERAEDKDGYGKVSSSK